MVRSFFGETLHELVSNGLRAEHSQGQAIITTETGELFRIFHNLQPEEPFDETRFKTLTCYAGDLAASDLPTVRDQATSKTIGYLFPLASFRNEADIDDEFIRKFADAGFQQFVTPERLSHFRHKENLATIRGQALYLDDVVDDNIALLVLSREVLGELEISDAELDFNLRRESVSICSNDTELNSSPMGFQAEGHLNLRRPKSILPEDLELLRQLLRNADLDNSKIGKFIQYYQFFEFMISKIFSWGIPQVYNDEGLTPWSIRERLEKIGGEKRRLSLLNSKCVPKLERRENLTQLKQVCSDLLQKLEIPFSEDAAWYTLLYRVRNSVVHDQILILKSGAINELSTVNTCLRQASLDLVFSFEQPDDGVFFSEP